jgi:hypothetical protein
MTPCGASWIGSQPFGRGHPSLLDFTKVLLKLQNKESFAVKKFKR